MDSASHNFTALTRDGCNLAVTSSGDGPPLLLIPGLGSARRVYAPIIPLLASRLRVVVYDPRGIGESGVTDGPYTMAQLAGDAVDVLDAAAIDSAAVFGASMGGMVAMHLALDHPDRVSQLIVAATDPGGAAASKPAPEATAALLGKGARTPADAYRLACTVLYSQRFQRARSDVIETQVAERQAHPVRARAFTAQYEAVRAHDVADRLPSLRMPTLVLHGSEDAVNPVNNARTIGAQVPGAQVMVLPELGHLFFHEDPNLTADVITAFVDP